MEGSKKEEVTHITKPKPIFPHIEIVRKTNALVMTTFLRKKHRGKYYLWHFFRSAYVPDTVNDYSAAVSSLTRDVYLAMHYGKIDPKATYRDGTLIYPLSKNQHHTEKERVDPKRFDAPEEPTEN